MNPVRAQVVWKHELDHELVWADAHPDTSMGGAAQVILALAFEVPIRAQELMRLRITSVRFCLDTSIPYAEVDIAHDAISGRLKTPGSQRTMTIRNKDTIRLLQEWVASRISMGAPVGAYLFGDPMDDKLRYRPAATLSLVSQLLKAATGDSKISLHTLRHSSLSTRISEVWSSTASVDLNRIEVIAAHAGHASGWTTLTSYSHIYEAGLRVWLNAGMREHFLLDSNMVASIAGMTSVNVRKTASRKGVDCSDYGWALLQSKAKLVSAQPAGAPFNWCDPQCPVVKRSIPRVFTVGVAESMTHDLMLGKNTSVIASRYGFSENLLVNSITKVVSVHNNLAKKAFPRISEKWGPSSTTLSTSVSRLDVDFGRRTQRKFDAMRLALDRDANQHILKKGVEGWLVCFRGTYLSLTDTNAAVGVLALLKHCEIDSTALRICIQRAAPGTMDHGTSKEPSPWTVNPQSQWNPALQRHAIANAFKAIFGIHPIFTDVGFDRNRPMVYLQWDSNQNALEKSASKGSTAGLDAIMISIQLYLSLLEESR